ncbi:UPF0605 protein GA14893-like [Bradysia coprophila]|uniref:UPF0605 protein GA14893-like n=1 Tax=Bradysia coprophila TaxID=38358 RepID=UPI00187D9DBF|nr:UPF0605 protein GA14893-like [Bradysia coprophila]
MLSNLETEQPSFIPGYSGYCPQYKYRIGETFGSQTHKLLIDPCAGHSENLILSDRTVDDYHIERPTLQEIDIVKKHERDSGDTIYKYPIIPGYEGFVPRINGNCGQRFFVAATEGLAEFQMDNLKNRRKRNVLRHRGALQQKSVKGRSLGERLLTTNPYRLPLTSVRPECKGVVRDLEVAQSKLPSEPTIPYSKQTSPFFMENSEAEKYLKSGNAGHKPFAWPLFGKDHQRITNDALCDFSNNFNHHKSTEWAPIVHTGVGASIPSESCHQIYHRNIGLLPNYGGHVPGAVFRFGQTYGADSLDAKRWLRGQFSN